MKEYKGYLFDLDGTLIDTTQMILRCFQHTLAEYENDRVKVDTTEILSSIGRPFKDQLDIFFEKNNLSKPDYKMLANRHMTYQGKIWQEYLRVFDEVPALLARLQQRGAKMAVVTSRKQPSASTFMHHVGIEKYFPVLVTPEITKQHKPHPEPALYALREIDCVAKDTLFVGDSRFDIGCANSAGIDSFLVRRKEAETMWASSQATQATYVDDTLVSIAQ